MPALRLAITGVSAGPDLMSIMEIIGKEETAQRIDRALLTLEHTLK
jgi:glutamyl-tRNA synthetase